MSSTATRALRRELLALTEDLFGVRAPILTTVQFSTLTGLHPQTVRELIASGKVQVLARDTRARYRIPLMEAAPYLLPEAS